MEIHVEVTVDGDVYADIGNYDRVMAKRLADDVGPAAIAKLHERVAHWKKLPQFETELERVGGEWRLYLLPYGATGMIWEWHVQGVPPRDEIRPRIKSAVSFNPGPRAPHLGGVGRVTVSVIYDWPGISSKRDEYITKAFEEYEPTMRDKIRSAASDAFNAMQEAGVV